MRKSSVWVLTAAVGLGMMGATSAQANFTKLQPDFGNRGSNNDNGRKDNHRNDNDCGDNDRRDNDRNNDRNKGRDNCGDSDRYCKIDMPKCDFRHSDRRDDRNDNKGRDKHKMCSDTPTWNHKGDWKNCDGGGKNPGKNPEPSAVPLPAAAWSGLTTMLGGALALGYRKFRGQTA